MKNLKYIVLTALFSIALFSGVRSQPQKIKIEAAGIPLNQVFFELRDKYGLQFTFNDRLLSGYKITTIREFETKEAAVSFLLKGLPLEFEKNGDVFVIFSAPQKQLPALKKYSRVGGQVVEAGTFEPLPFSYISINNNQVQSDQNGNFNYLASADTSINLQISHLGYFVFDTVFTQGATRKFLLNPSTKELGEVKVAGFTVEKSTLIGDAAGIMTVNQTIAPYLPGYGDNSVFNVLRLLPGVLASGEQSADLLVWGSYESQTKVEFDGFTLFGLKNHNDNIGVVNPLLIKNIRVLKGGYESSYDDRVGGIVQITGKNGNLYKPSATLNINNSTVNILGEIPVGKKSSLLASWRQTYYELYNPYNLDIWGNQNMDSSSGQRNGGHGTNSMVDVLVVPDYKFSDASLKYTARGKNGELVSAGLYKGGDRYAYNIDGNYNNHQLDNSLDEKYSQLGATVMFAKPWGKSHNSQLKLNYSALKSNSSETNTMSTGGMNGMNQNPMKALATENEVGEFAAELTDNFSIMPGNAFEAGIGWQMNRVVFNQFVNKTGELALNSTSEKGYAFVQNTISIGEKIILTPGIRAVYENLSGKFYIAPRFSASVKISEPVKLNASWGKYHQFISKVSFVDENLNYSWYWVNSDGKANPVLEATHWVGGISYNKNDVLFSAEGFYKSTSGISRYFSGTAEINKGFYSGDGKSYGVDFYLKKEFKKNIAWISYTLSKAEENLSFDAPGLYRLAPHDQRHELKIAGIYNLKSFYFSADYVFGSGFEILKNYAAPNAAVPKYSRLDAAVVYKFSRGKIFGNVGISVLNVLNHQNIKYDNLKRIETGVSDFANIYSGAIPFSPTLFLKLGI